MNNNRNFPFQKAGLRPPLANSKPTNRTANPPLATGHAQLNSAAGGNVNGLGEELGPVTGLPDIGTLIEQIVAYFEGFSQDASAITANIQTVTEEITTGRQQIETFVTRADTFISRATIFGIILLIMMIIGLILLVIIAFRTGYHPVVPPIPTVPTTTLGVTSPR